MPACPSARVPACPCFFQAAGPSSNPFVAASFAASQCPGFIAGTLQLSNIRNLLRRHVMELAIAIAISPDVGSVVSFPKASATLSTSTPDAEAKRATLWLMASNCSPPRTPAFTMAASDSLARLNVSPVACPALERPACDRQSVPTDYRKEPGFY